MIRVQRFDRENRTLFKTVIAPLGRGRSAVCQTAPSWSGSVVADRAGRIATGIDVSVLWAPRESRTRR